MKWNEFKFLGVMLGLLFVSSTACTTGSGFKGEYSDPSEKEIVDDHWNESDARKTSEVLITAMVKKSWLKRFKKSHRGKRPIVIVDGIENRTDEHIDVTALMEAMRDELINSGTIRFVNAKKREKILDEINYQQKSGMVARNQQKSKGKQIGADFFLSGAISSQVHKQGGLKTVTYQTNLILTNLETSEIVWSQKYHIKKRFNRSSSKW